MFENFASLCGLSVCTEIILVDGEISPVVLDRWED